MYSVINFKTKKALREAAARRMAWLSLTLDARELEQEPPQITFFQPNNMFGVFPCTNGIETIEGPHNPKPHMWAARCEIVDGEVVKVS